jgi:hypothetical protein
MGKRSGVPHRDEELAALSDADIGSEIARCRTRLRISRSAREAKAWRKRMHWLEQALANRA